MSKFWATKGYWFSRKENGDVEIGLDDKSIVVFPKDTWLSIIASVSEMGETGDKFKKAEIFHDYNSNKRNKFEFNFCKVFQCNCWYVNKKGICLVKLKPKNATCIVTKKRQVNNE